LPVGGSIWAARGQQDIGEDETRKHWAAWVSREIGGNELVRDAVVDAALKEIARGGDTASAAEAARKVAQSLGVVIRSRAGQPLACRLCGSTPAASVTLHEHNGRIAWMVHKTNPGPFCRDCGIALFRQHQNSTMFQGWFGFISLFLTPVTMLINLIAWLRLRSLPAPHRDANVISRIPAPLNPGKPLQSRAGAYVALVVAALLTIMFVGPALSLTLGPNAAQSTRLDSSPRASPSRQGSFPMTGDAYAFISAPGDFIGQGQAQTLTPPAWSFAASQGNLGSTGMAVSVRSGSGAGLVDWTIEMAPPVGESLHVGTYTNAMRAAFRQGGQPGLDVFGDGRGCNNVFGSFTVSELEIGADGIVRAFEATFTQHCESVAAPALNGHVRFAFEPETTTSPPPGLAQPGPFPPAGDAFSFSSQSGDYIGQGKAESLTPPMWTFAGQGTAVDGIYIDMRSGSGAVLVDWSVTIAAPRGQTLRVGTYTNAMRAPFREGTRPGLQVGGDARGCNEVYGIVTVTKIQVGSAGQVTAFEATFVQHCESPFAPGLYGHIRYVSQP
jgi:hypothetical protein